MGWTRAVALIDALLGKGHCKRAHDKDVDRAGQVFAQGCWDD